MPVLKQISPAAVPTRPIDLPLKTVPSSSIKTASCGWEYAIKIRLMVLLPASSLAKNRTKVGGIFGFVKFYGRDFYLILPHSMLNKY